MFTPKHFQDLGSSSAIDSAIRRLKVSGTIRQLARGGLYDYPVEHPILGIVAPSTDAIARALAVRDAVRLQPSGAYAANVLGLSEQVAEAFPGVVDRLLPEELRRKAQADREQIKENPDDGWGGEDKNR